ncbi:MAG: hypothetical protein ABSH20_23000 [Tepidisphaeraceae bacterium]
MPRIPDTTNLQTTFLRAFRKPGGPPPSLWPSPAILRKWLRHPGFIRALNSILETLRFQSDFHLATAATYASGQLPTPSAESSDNASPPADSPDKPPSSLKTLESILRLAHVRQRFAAVESRHAATQTLTGELARVQSELAEVRAQLAHAQQELRLSVRLDPFIMQREHPE